MEVIVVGGGVTGSFAAYYLLKKGHNVTVVDYEPMKGVKTSVYNAGSLSAQPSFTSIGISNVLRAFFGKKGPVYVSPKEILKNPIWYLRALKSGANPYNDVITTMSVTSLALYDQFFRDEHIKVDVIKGGLRLYNRGVVAEKEAAILGCKFVSPTELNQMGFKGFGGGVLYDGKRVEPISLLTSIRDVLEDTGVKLITGKASLSARHGRVDGINIGYERIKAESYVIAAGAWCNTLCAPLGYNPHIVPARGLVTLYDTGGKQLFDYPATLEDEGIVIVQHTNTVLRLTGYFELVGFNAKYRTEKENWLLQSTKAHMARETPLRLIEKGVGFRPCTPDQLPIVGKVPHVKNAYIVSGGCRKGVTLAPIMGALIASMVSGESTDTKLTQRLDPLRYA